jgi:hypothetical protein
LLARKRCCCWHEAHKQAAWAVRQLVLASTYKLVGLQLMQPHRFTQPKQNGWSLHGRDAAAVQLMGCLLQCIQRGSSHQADAGHGGNLLARKRCFCWHHAHKQAASPTPRGQLARERSGRARASCADMRYHPPARGALHALRVACLNFRTSNAKTWATLTALPMSWSLHATSKPIISSFNMSSGTLHHW